MSRLIAVRIPDDLLDKMVADPRGISAIVIHALKVEYGFFPVEDFGRDFPAVLEAKAATTPPRRPSPPRDSRAPMPQRQDAPVAALAHCNACGKPTIDWGGEQRRCVPCGRNWPR